MGLNADEAYNLRKSIQECSTFQGKYYLWHLYHILNRSKQPASKVSRIASHLIDLIHSINELNAFKNAETRTFKDMNKLIQSLHIHYSVLAEETGSQGIYYNFRQSILALGGCILGAVGLVIGSLAGICAGFIEDVKCCRLPTGAFFGGIAGAHIGAALGYRLLDRLVKDPEQHAIHYALRELHRTFESLSTLAFEGNLGGLKQHLLVNHLERR